MDAKPKRHWFRFRLSSVLILTAIAAWGVAAGPWTYSEEIHAHGSPNALIQDSDYIMFIDSPNPYAMFPLAALAAFLAWKAAWAVVDRRCRKAVAAE